MTTQRYADTGCAAGSQETGLASRVPANPHDYAFGVNLNNGNTDWNNQNNKGLLLPCRPAPRAREYQSENVSLFDLYQAYRAAMRNKQPSLNQLAFESQWGERLLDIQSRINDGSWEPGPTTCFVATRPKARQIHAADFGDRVVHHAVIPPLEAIYEPVFIHDSYANRTGKGTHAAVARVRDFVHEVDSGQGGGWFLKLDIANFFYSINRERLWHTLKRRMTRARLPDWVLRTAHSLISKPLDPAKIIWRARAEELARIPPHKRLENAAPGYGLPIGNLYAQFFANVYMNELDQFVKHQLGVRRYVRFVDDFVLIHQSRAQLEYWQRAIEEFLRAELDLTLKADIQLRPLRTGIDFLGYVIYPTHTRVRARVVKHAFSAVTAASAERRAAVLASYLGHFEHANAQRLARRLRAQAESIPQTTGRDLDVAAGLATPVKSGTPTACREARTHRAPSGSRTATHSKHLLPPLAPTRTP